MTVLRITAPSAIATLLLFAAPAAAEPPWAEASTYGPQDRSAGAAQLAFGRDGSSLIAYAVDAASPGVRDTRTRLLFRDAGGVPQNERGRNGNPEALAADGAGFLLLRARLRRLQLDRLGADGAPVDSTLVTRRAVHPRLAAASEGVAAVAWVRQRRGPATVFARPADGGRRVRLGRAAAITDLAVAVAPDGAIAAVWAEGAGTRRRVRARVLPPEADRPRRPVRLGRHAGAAAVAAVYGSDRRLFVAWSSQDAGEDVDRALTVRAAAVGRSGRRVRARQLVDRGDFDARPPAPLRLAAVQEGPVVGYSMPVRDPGSAYTTEVRAAAAGAGGAYEEPVTLAADAVLGDLVAGPQGSALATWTQADSNWWWTAVHAAVRPPAGPWGPVESVVSQESVTLPRAAFSPLTERPSVVWSGTPGFDDMAAVGKGENPPPYRVRVSERTG